MTPNTRLQNETQEEYKKRRANENYGYEVKLRGKLVHNNGSYKNPANNEKLAKRRDDKQKKMALHIPKTLETTEKKKLNFNGYKRLGGKSTIERTFSPKYEGLYGNK